MNRRAALSALGTLGVTLAARRLAAAAAMPEVVAQAADPVRAFVVVKEQVFTVAGSGLHGWDPRGGAQEPRDLATLDETRVVSTIVALGDDLLIGAIGVGGRTLSRVPQAGGPVERLSEQGGTDVVALGARARWLEALGPSSSGVAELLARTTDPTAPLPVGPPFPGVARTLAFDDDAVYVALHDTLRGPGSLVRRGLDGAESVLFRGQATLLVAGSDALHVYLVERGPGHGRVVAVPKAGGTAATVYTARAPGEFVLGPRVALDGASLWIPELDTRGASDAGTLWRVPLAGGTPTPAYSGRLVSQPALSGGYVYFVETEKLTGASRVVRLLT